MKLTIEEYGMLMKAVLDKADVTLNLSELSKKQECYLTSDYYAARFKDYKNLHNKLAEMMDDITE